MSGSIVSVASNSSAGAAGGSVIDVASLVAQLVQATEAPQQAIITQNTQAVSTEISAVGALKSALAQFQSTLSAIDTPSAFNSLSHEQQYLGVHCNGELQRHSGLLQRQRRPAGRGTATGLERLLRWQLGDSRHGHATADSRRQQFQCHHRQQQ